MTNYFNDLDKIQQEAVKNYKGPSLIIAGAGSGKTRVLTYRIAYLLSKGIYANTILALTFTNKAASEMKERIAKLAGHDLSKHLWMGTFHSIFAKILRIESELIKYPYNYTIYDTIDSKSLLRAIIKEFNLDDQIYKPNIVLGRISLAKNSLITWDKYLNSSTIYDIDKNSRKPEIGNIYKEYALRCRHSSAMDFDDLLLNIYTLFNKFPDILKKYQEKFKYLLVDEYQDTNFVQYKIVNKLAALHNNVSVVGDDSQSIYSFRGAKIENILNFKKDYPEYTLYKLEQNYRSTQTIVNAANSLIEKNKNRIPKVLFSEKNKGEKIEVIATSTDREESFVIINEISDKICNQQAEYKDFAILYRINAQSRVFEEALRKKNIPYKIYGGISFYQRKEIKDLIAYFRLIVNQYDEEALKRIINYPARGIGQTTVNKLIVLSKNNNINIWEVITNPEKYLNELSIGTKRKISTFVSYINSYINRINNEDTYKIAYSVAKSSGILKDLLNDNTTEGISKHENIQELLNGIKEFVNTETEDGQIITIDKFVENVSLLTNADTEKKEDRNKVTLMTMHSAKGLEFRNVYIVGVEEEIFPSKLSIGTLKELEEERRLFYVAITRAKVHATISYARTRYRWGDQTNCIPSRFIKDIDPKYLDIKDNEIKDNEINNCNSYNYKNQFFTKQNNFERYNKKKNKINHEKPFIPPNLKSFKQVSRKTDNETNSIINDNTSNIQTGMVVEHARFGIGKVLNLEGTFPNIKATVFFKSEGQKQLLLKFAKLKIIS
ncbi:MAG: UvrD-helicase domain-containing protein [Bacteroidales bacterium]|nr:UvrD-helicase domain-containing protein [Bacteroidales bacterium]